MSSRSKCMKCGGKRKGRGSRSAYCGICAPPKRQGSSLMELLNAAAADEYKRTHAEEFPAVVVPPSKPAPAPVPQTSPAEDKFPGLTGEARRKARNAAKLKVKLAARDAMKTGSMASAFAAATNL
jgi:hypothetical protein